MSAASTLAEALKTRLQGITVTNGFATDAGVRVYKGRRRLAEEHIPCVVIIEGDDKPNSQSLKSSSIVQRYMLEAHSECDPDNPNDVAHEMIADMKRAIFSADTTFERKVKRIEYVGRTISPREDGLNIVAAGIEIELTYVEDLTNP